LANARFHATAGKLDHGCSLCKAQTRDTENRLSNLGAISDLRRSFGIRAELLNSCKSSPNESIDSRTVK
jgi:hypothetical protein